MRALVIDDSRAVRKILRQFLEEEGYEVHEAADGMEALAQVHEHGSFEIALVDWNMPGLNGLEFVKAIRAMDKYRKTPIVMITSEAAKYHVLEAVEAGVTDYVVKPIDGHKLWKKLSQYV